MTVALQTPYSPYTGNGVTTVFPYTFKILDEEDLRVYVGGVLQTLNVNYSVSGVGVDTGGSVTFLTGAPGAVSVSILRAMVVERSTDYQVGGDFNASAVNPDFDRAILLIQDMQTQLGRSIRTPADEVATLPTLPAIASRSGKYISFDATGQPIASVGTGNDTALRTDLAASTGSTLVGWLSAGVGAVVRSVLDLFRERISVKDFGAVGDGVTIDTAAINAAITYAGSLSFRGIVRFPKGMYKHAGFTIATQGVSIEGEGRRETVLWYYTGAGDGITVTGQNVRIKKMQVHGNASALSLIRWTNAPQGYMADVHGSMNGSPNDGFVIEKASFYHLAFDCMVDGSFGGVTTGARGWVYQQNGGTSGPNSSASLFCRAVQVTRGMALIDGNDYLVQGLRAETDITIGVDVGANVRDLDIIRARFDWNVAGSIGVKVANGALRINIVNPRNDIAGAGAVLLSDLSASEVLMQEGRRFTGKPLFIGSIFVSDPTGDNPAIDFGTSAGTQRGLIQITGTIFDFFTRLGNSLRFRVNGGDVVIAADAASNVSVGKGLLATSATDGFLYVPSCAGTPTGVPTAKAGFVPIVVNTTNNKLYFYSTGVWRDAGP